MTRPTSLDDGDDLDAFVAAHEVALVEFYTAGCTMCQAMEPVLGNVSKATETAVATVNPRDDPVLIERFDVQSVPLLVLFVDGDPVARLAEGFQGASDVLAFVDANAPDGVATGA